MSKNKEFEEVSHQDQHEFDQKEIVQPVEKKGEFEALMQEQDEIQSALQEKQGGVLTIDDTEERRDRSEKIAVDGKRRGSQFKPTKGVARFMMQKNALYKSQGKVAPYTARCIEETLKREK